jgi:hypothetical protein
MNSIILSVSLALAQLVAVNALAQTKGEADPAQSKAIPSAPATAAEKAAAKQTRKAEGKQAASAFKGGEGPSTDAKAKVATKEERADAAKKRKVAAASSLKKGEISSGEK